MASIVELGRVALDVILAVGPMVSSENVAKTHHVVQMRHSRLESFREDVRDMLVERLDSSQNLTLKSTLLFGFVAAILVDGFPPQKMQSEMSVDFFIFVVPWGICLLFQSMTFAVLYQRGMMTVGHQHLRELQLLVTQQAEEEHVQGETFVEIVGAQWHRSHKRLKEIPHQSGVHGVRQVLGLLGSTAWGLFARLFAIPGTLLTEPCDDSEDWRSVDSEHSDPLESSPSRPIALDYLTLELHNTESTTAGMHDVSDPAHSSGSKGGAGKLVHVTEMSNMPEVKALELYEDQANLTVVSGSLFTLASLGCLVFTRLQMRREEYSDHPMAFWIRMGIFMPPLLIAAFASLIRPYPVMRHERHSTHSDKRRIQDCSSPHSIRPATYCIVLLGVVVSVFCLITSLCLHAPPFRLALQPTPLLPVTSVTEWYVRQWPLFFSPTGVMALEDGLVLTTDFHVARFALRDSDGSAILEDEQALSGMEIKAAVVVNSSVIVAGRRDLHSFSVGPAAQFPWHHLSGTSVHASVGSDSIAEVVRGLSYWREKDLLFLAGPTLGVVAARPSKLNSDIAFHVSIDFRLALDEVAVALSVDEAKKLLYVLLSSGELLALDLADNPGVVLQRYRLPQADSYVHKAGSAVSWTGIASLGDRIFAVTHSPAKIFSFELPQSLRQRCGSAHLRRCKTH
mmetsp:Transcript_22803/g.52783  ORF Transcript_22803/g.52783 Transcript_22803/m.52783 type:complete len:680 (-) Transcript_22803:193-2232(-)